MKIVADANIPFAREAFAQFGEVTTLPGRHLTPEDLRGAEVLVVRSVTKVNQALLAGSEVRFVGTATIGTDHLDISWLDGAGIQWRSAAGCNARSVVEWVMAGIVEWCLAQRINLAGLTLGIVGHGNIGSRLAALAPRLGMKILVCDPPLARQGKITGAVDLATVLAQSDIVTFHVPYTRTGEDATHGLAGWEQLDLMRPGALLLNSSRGAVLDNEAARSFAKSGGLHVLLDVYENEPTPNRELVRYAFLSTPHIAGYSYEGKVNGTRMMAEAIAAHLGTTSSWVPPLDSPADNVVEVRAAHPLLAAREAIRRSYDITADSNALREGLAIEDEAAWGAHFDNLRKNYPVRREFANYRVPLGHENTEAAALVAALGFAM